jgi:hypothetical protein
MRTEQIMNVFFRSAFSALAAVALVGVAVAQAPKRIPAEAFVESSVSEVVLPSSINGTLVMKACSRCDLKSYPVSASTKYFLFNEPVTLPELTAAIVGQPKAFVGVTYSPKSGEVTEVTAHAKRVRR